MSQEPQSSAEAPPTATVATATSTPSTTSSTKPTAVELLLGAAKERDDGTKAHAFWDTQPVPKLLDKVEEVGPVETKTVADVQKTPLSIATTFEWWVPDIHKADELQQIHELLRDNYVEDDDSLFRFNYSAEFLKWALTPPGYFKDWHVAVRKRSDKKVLAFISGIPIACRLGDQADSKKVLCEINFLCVHKLLREKRMAPILIKEVTRRVNLCDIWQAVYTAGIVLPKPITSARYWHRSLNPAKLCAIGFSRIPRQYEKFQNPMEMLKRNYALPDKPTCRGIRPLKPADVPHVCKLLNEYLLRFPIAPVFNEKEFAHWMLPRAGVLHAYVIANAEDVPTDFVSFYSLPSTVIGNTTYQEVNAAYSYYYVAKTVSLKVLMTDALILAKSLDHDVFNTLDILDNKTGFIDHLKFGQGDGTLQYYLYNWKFPELKPPQIGLVML